jgi:predicted ribosome quality control (RQC) complex YloA/Tae2 family protein
MFFDSLILARIAAEVQGDLVGASVERVFAPGRDAVALDFRRRLERPQLLLSWAAEGSRVHLSASAEPQPGVTSPMADVLRRHLRGATLVGCAQMAFDRVLLLEFANCLGLGPQSRNMLVAEVMGRLSNLVLVDAEGQVVACAKAVRADVNRYREVLPGQEYIPPPALERLDPRTLTADDLRRRAPDAASVRDLLAGALMGASERFVEEALTRARLAGDESVESAGDWAPRLVEAIQAMIAEAEAPGRAFVYRAKKVFAYPLVLESHLEWDAEPTCSLSAALETLAAEEAGRQQGRQARERLLAAVRRGLEKAEGRRRERERTLREAEDAESLRRRGELLLANLHLVRPRAESVTVTDFYDPNQAQIEIALDPRLAPADQAQALFSRYKRARRILDRVPPLLAEAQQEREYLEGVRQQVQAAEDLTELTELEEELRRGGYLKEPARRLPKAPAGTVQPRRATSADGYAILYGKTGAQNDALLRAAAPEDIWFHVKDGPGGHVLVRTSGRADEVPRSTLLEAAARAAALSQWRNDHNVEVNYTRAKHLHKPRGARPGFVTYTHFQTLAVEPLRH